MSKKLLLPLVLGVFFIGACAQEEQGLSNEDKKFNYFRCVEKETNRGWQSGIAYDTSESIAKQMCLYHLD